MFVSSTNLAGNPPRVLLFVADASIRLKLGKAEEFFFACNDLCKYCCKVKGNCFTKNTIRQLIQDGYEETKEQMKKLPLELRKN